MSTPDRTPRRYGLDPRRAVSTSQIHRDVRPLHHQIADIFTEPMVPATIIFMLALLILLIPGALYFVVPLALLLRRICVKRPDELPFNMPAESEMIDRNDPKPGRLSAYRARGMVFLGNDMDESWELWTTFNVLLRHMTYFGTTGSGKSEALLSLFANFLGFGGSCIYNDAKGTMKLVWQGYTISRFFGRDDDFLTLNYITGNVSAKPDPAVRMTNDTNPFTVGSADSLTQMMMGLLPGSGPNDPNKLFSERAIGLISSMMPALVELRDKGQLMIDPGVIRRYMEFTEFVSLVENPAVSMDSKEPVYAYMASLSGFVADREPAKQPEEVTRQFGFAQAYFTRALSSLSDTYGNIYMTQLGEVSPADVVMNNRILFTILPAMEKSDEELSNLGKINLSALRNAMSLGLGSKLEGDRAEVLESLPTSTAYPTGIILDELAYQAVPGIAITAAQARGLMFSLTFASQEMSSLSRVLDKEAMQLIANTRIKVIMALEDAGETVQLVSDLVGQGQQMLSDGYRIDEDTGNINYYDSKSASVKEAKRIDLMDLRGLNEGEAFVIYQDRIVRTNLFWHGFSDDDLITNFKVHRKMKTRVSDRGVGMTLFSREQAVAEKELDIWLRNLDINEIFHDPQIPSAFDKVMEVIKQGRTQSASPTNMSLAAIACYSGTIPSGAKKTAKQAKKPLLGNLVGNAYNDGSDLGYDDRDKPSSEGDENGIMSEEDSQAAIDAAEATLQAALANEIAEVRETIVDGGTDQSILSEANYGLQDKGGMTLDELETDNNSGDLQVISKTYADREDDEDEPEEDLPTFLKVFVPEENGSIEMIGKGIAHLETTRGASAEEAKENSQKAMKLVSQSLEYPTDPTVKRERDFGLDEVRNSLDNWVNYE